MDIRRAQPGDYDEALRLVKQVHYMHYEHLSYLYNDIEPLPRDRFYEDLSNPDMITLMAFDGGVPWAYARSSLSTPAITR